MEAANKIGSDDFSLSKVEEANTMKWYDICTVYTTFTIIPTGIMLGVIVAKHFPFYEALQILALGSSLVIANALLMGFIGYRERTSFALTTRFAFGARGSRLPSALLVVSSQGWWVIQLLLLMSFWPHLDFWSSAGLLVASGTIMTTTSFLGLEKGIKWLDRIVLPLLAVFFVVSISRAIDVGGGWEAITNAVPPSSGALGFAAATIMVAALWINGATVYPDVSRYAKSSFGVALAGISAFVVGLFGLGTIGVIFYNALGAEDFGPAFSKVELEWAAFALVFIQVWTTNQNQMYSSSLALANVLNTTRTRSELILFVISISIIVLLSAFAFQDVFEGFLIFLGLFLTPIPGVVIGQYYLIDRMRPKLSLENLAPVNMLAMISYAITALLNFSLWLFVPAGAPIGLITLNPLTACLIHVLVTGLSKSFISSPQPTR